MASELAERIWELICNETVEGGDRRSADIIDAELREMHDVLGGLERGGGNEKCWCVKRFFQNQPHSDECQRASALYDKLKTG